MLCVILLCESVVMLDLLLCIGCVVLWVLCVMLPALHVVIRCLRWKGENCMVVLCCVESCYLICVHYVIYVFKF